MSWLLSLAALLVQDSAPFVVAPVRTELQRALLDIPQEHLDGRWFVLVGGNQFIDEGAEDCAFELAESLSSRAPEGGSAHLQVAFQPPFPSPADRASLQAALNASMEEIDFECRMSTRSSSQAGAFESMIERFTQPAIPSSSVAVLEPVVRSSFGIAGRAMEPLTRHLAGGADSYLGIREPLRQRDGYLTEGQGQALLDLLTRAGVENGKLSVEVRVLVAAGDGFQESYERLHDFLAESGHQMRSFTNGLQEDPRADELLGNEVPDVALTALDETPIRLPQLIENKAALITFWGVG